MTGFIVTGFSVASSEVSSFQREEIFSWGGPVASGEVPGTSGEV